MYGAMHAPEKKKRGTYLPLCEQTMKVEIHRFKDGRLQLLIRFEEDSNFRMKDSTWVPKKNEINLICDSLQAIDEYNGLKSKLPTIYK